MKLGEIQGIEIFDEGRLDTIWLVQERVGNINSEEIKRRNFKVSAILTKNGYQIHDPEQFDVDFKELFKRIEEEKEAM